MGSGREFTLVSVFLGVLIGVLFGAANAFLGLKVGMTVSASIPAAVISMGILRGLFRRNSLLENNIVQTIGSAGTSVASGVVFTVPALFIMGISPDYWTIAAWAAIGGTLGVLFMIPLRHYLVVKEHENLRYPEGLACAEVLEAGERGGGLAKTVFWGLGISLVYSTIRDLGFFRSIASIGIPQLRTKATLDASPALLGVGYIIGPKISAYMLSGAVLGWYVIIPGISYFGAAPFGPVLDVSTVTSVPLQVENWGTDAPPNLMFAIPDGRSENTETILLAFETQRPLDSTSSGLSITLPEALDASQVQFGGITAGDYVYEAHQQVDGQTITLSQISPSLGKTKSMIHPGWVNVVLHNLVNDASGTYPVSVSTFNAPGSVQDEFEISTSFHSPKGETLTVTSSKPGDRHFCAVVTHKLWKDIGNDRERITFALGDRFELGYTDELSHDHHPVEVVSIFDGSSTFGATASILEDPTSLDREIDAPLLMTSAYSPSPAETPIKSGMVTVVLHGLVNPETPAGTDEFEAITIASPGNIFPASMPIAEMGPDEVHKNFVRYIGAGAVAVGGLLSLLKSFPTILGSIWHLFLAMFGARGGTERTSRDLPFILLAAGVVAIAGVLWKLPQLEIGWVGTLLVCVFGFFFVTVSSRLVGQIGSSSNPTSGMTIATLLGTALIYFYFFPSLENVKLTSLTVGAIVCIAIAVSGDCSQDLKTGFLVKATPWKQQIGELIGVITAAACIAGVIFLLNEGYGFTPDRPNRLNAPQANLMAMLLNGVFDQNLPWLFVGMGIACGLVVEFLGIGCLPFAVGLYLPLSLSTPIMIGGLIRLIVDKVHHTPEPGSHDAGVLGASGFVAGEGLVGVGLGGVTAFCAWMWPQRDISCQDMGPGILQYVELDTHYQLPDFWFKLLPLAPFALVALWLFATALRRAIPTPPPPVEPYPEPDVSYKHRLPSFDPTSGTRRPGPIQIPQPPQRPPGSPPPAL